MRTIIPVLITCFVASAPAEAARKTRKRRVPKPAVYTVKPSEEIEERVDAESERAKAILGSFTVENLFASPYLTAAMYYHDGFLSGFPDEKHDADPARRIVARLQRDLTLERKAQYVRLLLQYWRQNATYADSPSDRFAVPVPYEPPPIEHLRRQSLLTFVPHLWTGDPTNSGRRGIHLYGLTGAGEQAESEIANAAHTAALAMVPQWKLSGPAKDEYRLLAPIVNSLPDVQVVGIARLHYRPHTKRTSQWYADLMSNSRHWLEHYVKLAKDAEKAQAETHWNEGFAVEC